MNKLLLNPTSKIDWLLMDKSVIDDRFSCSTQVLEKLSGENYVPVCVPDLTSKIDIETVDSTKETDDQCVTRVVTCGLKSPLKTNSCLSLQIDVPGCSSSTSSPSPQAKFGTLVATSNVDSEFDCSKGWLLGAKKHVSVDHVQPTMNGSLSEGSSAASICSMTVLPTDSSANSLYDLHGAPSYNDSLSEKCCITSHSGVEQHLSCATRESVPDRKDDSSQSVIDNPDCSGLQTPRTTTSVTPPAQSPSKLSCKTSIPSPSQSHVCNLCGKQYRHGASLKNHLRKHESGALVSKRYRCPYCVYSSQYNRNVTKHVETTHCNIESGFPLRSTHSVTQFSNQGSHMGDNQVHKIAPPSWKTRIVNDPNNYKPFKNDPMKLSDPCYLHGYRRHATIKNSNPVLLKPNWNDANKVTHSIKMENDGPGYSGAAIEHPGKSDNPVDTSYTTSRNSFCCEFPGCNRTFKTAKYLANHFNDCHRDSQSQVFDQCPSDTYRSRLGSSTEFAVGRRNSLQELLSPDRGDIQVQGSQSALCVRQENGVFDNGRQNTLKRPYGEVNSSTSNGTYLVQNTKISGYSHSGFTDSRVPSTTDIYSFPGTQIHPSKSNGSDDFNELQRSGERRNFATSLEGLCSVPPAPSDVPQSTVSSNNVSFNVVESSGMQQQMYYGTIPSSEHAQPDQSWRYALPNRSQNSGFCGRCGDCSQALLSQRTAEGFGVEAFSENDSVTRQCSQLKSRTVAQLLCAPSPTNDDIRRSLVDDRGVFPIDKKAASGTRELSICSTNLSQLSDDSDFANSRGDFSDRLNCGVSTPTLDSDLFVHGQLSSETDAFLSDLEEILAREVPLFESSTPHRNNSDCSSREPSNKSDYSATKSPVLISNIKQISTSSLLSGDSGLESWSSSSSCSAGANSSSIWGSQDPGGQLKFSPHATTPQPCSDSIEHSKVAFFDQYPSHTHTNSDQASNFTPVNEPDFDRLSSNQTDPADECQGPNNSRLSDVISSVIEELPFRPLRTPYDRGFDSTHSSTEDCGSHLPSEYYCKQVLQPQLCMTKMDVVLPNMSAEIHSNYRGAHAYPNRSDHHNSFSKTDVTYLSNQVPPAETLPIQFVRLKNSTSDMSVTDYSTETGMRSNDLPDPQQPSKSSRSTLCGFTTYGTYRIPSHLSQFADGGNGDSYPCPEDNCLSRPDNIRPPGLPCEPPFSLPPETRGYAIHDLNYSDPTNSVHSAGFTVNTGFKRSSSPDSSVSGHPGIGQYTTNRSGNSYSGRSIHDRSAPFQFAATRNQLTANQPSYSNCRPAYPQQPHLQNGKTHFSGYPYETDIHMNQSTNYSTEHLQSLALRYGRQTLNQEATVLPGQHRITPHQVVPQQQVLQAPQPSFVNMNYSKHTPNRDVSMLSMQSHQIMPSHVNSSFPTGVYPNTVGPLYQGRTYEGAYVPPYDSCQSADNDLGAQWYNSNQSSVSVMSGSTAGVSNSEMVYNNGPMLDPYRQANAHALPTESIVRSEGSVIRANNAYYISNPYLALDGPLRPDSSSNREGSSNVDESVTSTFHHPIAPYVKSNDWSLTQSAESRDTSIPSSIASSPV